MKLGLLFCLAAFTLFAEEPQTTLQNGVFFGLGGSYNSVKLDQNLHGNEFSSVFSGASLVSLGQSGGSANPYHKTKATLAPVGELGYLYRFSNSNWFLGAIAAYQYLGLTFAQNNIDSFPAGLYASVGGGDTWVGHLTISSSQTHVDHELFFLPMLGYFFNRGSVYLGAGPVVFGTKSILYGVRGFASVNGASFDLTGAGGNLSFSDWVWGGAAQLGMLYKLASKWFLDLNYSYAVTGNAESKDSVLFSNTMVSGTVYTEEGIASVNSKTRITSQSFSVSINRVF
jgi:hypothetical protein